MAQGETLQEAHHDLVLNLNIISSHLTKLEGRRLMFSSREEMLDMKEGEIDQEADGLDRENRELDDEYQEKLARINHKRHLLQGRRARVKHERDLLTNDRSSLEEERQQLTERQTHLRSELKKIEDAAKDRGDRLREEFVKWAETMGLDPNQALTLLFPTP